MYSLKTIFKDILFYKKDFIKGNLVAVAATIVSVPIPLFIPAIIDEILLQKSGWYLPFVSSFLPNQTSSYYIVVTLLWVVFLRGAFFIFTMWQTKLFKRIAGKVTFKIRQATLQHLQKISLSSYENIGSGKLTSLLVTDINTIDEFISMTVSRLLISFLTIIGVAVVLIYIQPLLAFLLFVLKPTVSFITSYMGKRVAKLKEKENTAFSNFQESLSQTMELFVQIRASNREQDYIAKTLHSAKQIRDTSIEFGYKSEVANRFSFLIFMIGYEGFRIAGVFLVLASSLTIGSMLAVFGYIWFVMNPLQELLNIQYTLHNARMALSRINQVFLLEQEPQYPHKKNPFGQSTSQSIELQNVSFSYNKEKVALNNISLKMESGSRVAIVGSSGSGKTTLAQVIVGFYPIQAGKVFYNNIDVQDIGLDVVRQHVSLIVQNPGLFHDTLEMNLTMGKETSVEKIWQALEIAQIKNFVKELPHQLQTQVGKHGIRLSGGQRQRIAIARMILANPSVVILDESTSALDVETEVKLFDSLLHYFQDKTVIIIAHRLSTIAQADMVFVIENGSIIQRGTPKKLSQKEGYYSNFIRRQT